MSFIPLNVNVTSDGELYTTETEREINVYSSYSKSSISGTGYAALVDLNNTGSWPHSYTGRLDLSFVSVSIDRTSGSVGSVGLGVITSVGTGSGNVAFIGGAGFNNNSETYIRVPELYSPSQLKLGVASATGLYRVATSSWSLGDTRIRTTAPLDSWLGSGTVTPAVGDLVIRYILSSGTPYSSTVRVFYHSHTGVS